MKKSTDADLGRWRVFHDRPGLGGAQEDVLLPQSPLAWL